MTAFKYYLGLDMGTNSVGWAATDPGYRLLKAKGKDLWGIREFNEACGTVQITASDMGVKLYTDFGFVHNDNFMQYKI